MTGPAEGGGTTAGEEQGNPGSLDDHGTLEDLRALRSLAEQYAHGVDRRDREAYVGVFHPDAILEVYRARQPEILATRMQGHEELGRVTVSIARYERTFHLLGQSTYRVDGDRATGEVYCVARHLTPSDDGDTDRVMHIRYEDEYTRRDGRWAIQVRRLRNEWEEVHQVVRPEGFQA